MSDNDFNPYEAVKEVYDESVESNILSKLFKTNRNPNPDIVEDINNSKIAVYTAFTGDYDVLKDPAYIDENCDYICFTENESLESDVWDIRLMEDSNLDNNRKAKQYRIFPDKYLPEYKYSLWMDGTFNIVGSLREYISKYINSEMLVVVHTERDCIYDEAYACIPFAKYSNYSILNQIDYYKNKGMPKHYGLISSGVLFREHNNPIIKDLMKQWWDEIINFTNKDQISFSYVLWKNKYHPSVSDVYYWMNEYWTVEGNYQHSYEIPDYITSRNLIRSLEGNISDTNTLTKEELLLLIQDIEALEDETLQQNIVRNNLDNKINNLKNSKSWKMTSKLRKRG